MIPEIAAGVLDNRKSSILNGLNFIDVSGRDENQKGAVTKDDRTDNRVVT